jgi:hypothetical protein
VAYFESEQFRPDTIVTMGKAGFMTQSQPISGPPKTTLQPPCPTCSTPMWLLRLAPFNDDHDLRTFKCQVCDHTESMKVKFKFK